MKEILINKEAKKKDILLLEDGELKEKYTELVIPLISFKYDYPQYVKEINKALDGILEAKQWIEAIEEDIAEKEVNQPW